MIFKVFQSKKRHKIVKITTLLELMHILQQRDQDITLTKNGEIRFIEEEKK